MHCNIPSANEPNAFFGFNVAQSLGQVWFDNVTITYTGDINQDSGIDLNDYSQWLCEYQGNGICKNRSGQVTSTFSSDLNGNGQIDVNDFIRWLNHIL